MQWLYVYEMKFYRPALFGIGEYYISTIRALPLKIKYTIYRLNKLYFRTEKCEVHFRYFPFCYPCYPGELKNEFLRATKNSIGFL